MIQKSTCISIRIILVFILFLLNPFVTQAQEKSEKADRPKIALVLSGGGAKGFAHIGVLKVLEKEGIPIDMIVGTSIGSLVGGIYSLGYNASELEVLVKSLNWERVLTDDVSRINLSNHDQLLKQRYIFSLPINGSKKLSLPQGIIKGQNVLNLFCDLSGNVPIDADFSKFPIPFACVATNLETGEELVLNNGSLPTAMFSSMAIPVAFQSYDREGHLLVDGGIVNNFPTDVAKRMGADIIIGVDIRNDSFDRKKLKSLNNVLGQLINFFDQEKQSANKSYCDLIITPDITGYTMSSFNSKAVDTLIVRGETAANGLRKELRELKTKYGLETKQKSRMLVKPDKWHINDLSFTGNTHLDSDFLRKTLDMKVPGDFSADEIEEAIDRLYGLGGFDLIYYNLIDTEEGKLLNLNITTKNVFTQNIGFKANTTDATAILLNITQKNYGNVFGLLSASTELSVNPGLSIMAESNKTNFPIIGISIKGKYQNYNIYNKGENVYKINMFYSSGSVYIYKPFLKKFNLGIGIQEEYYWGDIFRKNGDYPVLEGKTSSFLTNAYSYLSFDNMDDFYFPTKGTNLYAEFSLLADFPKNNDVSPIGLFKMRNVIPLWSKTALLLDLYGRALYHSDSPQSKITLIGGESYSQYFNYHLPFVGLQAVNAGERLINIGLIGFRTQIAKKQYISLLFNGLRQSSGMNPWKNTSTIYGGGIKYAIMTFIGPLDMTLGYSSSADKLNFSANFGYWF